MLAFGFLCTFAPEVGLSVSRSQVPRRGPTQGNERGPKRILDSIASYLSHLKKKGAVRSCDPRVAAVHVKGLLDAGIVEPLLFGTRAELKSAGAALRSMPFLRA